MIVRIMGEGQMRVTAADLAGLNALDAELEAAITAGDETAFRQAFNALLDHVREVGKPLEEGSLEPSELILPPAEASIEEVRGMLTDDGLIPD